MNGLFNYLFSTRLDFNQMNRFLTWALVTDQIDADQFKSLLNLYNDFVTRKDEIDSEKQEDES